MKAFLEYLHEICCKDDTFVYVINKGTYGPTTKTINMRKTNSRALDKVIFCYCETTKSYGWFFSQKKDSKGSFYMLQLNGTVDKRNWRFL